MMRLRQHLKTGLKPSWYQLRNVNHEISSSTCQNGHHQSQQIKTAGEGVEKTEPSYTAGGNVNCCSPYGKQYGVSSKIWVSKRSDQDHLGKSGVSFNRPLCFRVQKVGREVCHGAFRPLVQQFRASLWWTTYPRMSTLTAITKRFAGTQQLQAHLLELDY